MLSITKASRALATAMLYLFRELNYQWVHPIWLIENFLFYICSKIRRDIHTCDLAPSFQNGRTCRLWYCSNAGCKSAQRSFRTELKAKRNIRGNWDSGGGQKTTLLSNRSLFAFWRGSHSTVENSLWKPLQRDSLLQGISHSWIDTSVP